jgi:hypothetical protein
MSMIFILIPINFDIDINNNELSYANTKREKKVDEKKLIITNSAYQHAAQVNRINNSYPPIKTNL